MGFSCLYKNNKGFFDGIEYFFEKRWKFVCWGDEVVGKWNYGVNGEEGLGGDW